MNDRKEYWNNGTLKYETKYNSDNTHINKAWYEDGQLRFSWPYKDNDHHGVSKGWYPDGRLKYTWPYKNGKFHGIREGHLQNGEIRYKYFYIYGKRVSEEEFRRYELITQLAGIDDD